MRQHEHTGTDAEAELEVILNRLGNGALRGEFKREWRAGDWTLDFYFPEIRLAIEVDGGYHRALSRWRKDQHKTRDLMARGITVLRLTNSEVFGDRERLVIRLRAAWRAALTRSHPRGPAGLQMREPEAPAYLVAPTRVRHCRASRRKPINLRGVRRIAWRMALEAPFRALLAVEPHPPTVLTKGFA